MMRLLSLLVIIILSFASKNLLGFVVKVWESSEITVAYVIVSILVSPSADRMLGKLKG